MNQQVTTIITVYKVQCWHEDHWMSCWAGFSLPRAKQVYSRLWHTNTRDSFRIAFDSLGKTYVNTSPLAPYHTPYLDEYVDLPF